MKDNKYFTEDGRLRIPMQFFAEGGDNAGSDGASDTSTADNSGTDNNTNTDNNTPDIEKLVQARTDKATAELGKKIASLQKELEKQKKANMTAEEIKKLEMSEKEAALAEREKMLLDKENRLLAIKALQKAGLNDGSNEALELVDFVMADNEEAITNKVTAFGALVNKLVEKKVNETFKQNGRNPNGSGNNSNSEDKKTNAIAEKLGKARAEKLKESNDILKFYTGGNS